MLILPLNTDTRNKISIGIADDHESMVKALSSLLEETGKFEVTLQVFHVCDVVRYLSMIEKKPDILLIGVYPKDIETIEMLKNIKASHPEVKTIAVCLEEDQQMLIRVVLAGCRGWILMDKLPNFFETAIIEVHEKEYFNADKMSHDFVQLVRIAFEGKDKRLLSEEEKKYLLLACSDLSFKEIVEKMNVPESTLDDYWNRLCDKLHVESRAGLVLEACSMGLDKHLEAAEVSENE